MASIETRTITTNSFEARVIDLPTGYAKMLYWYLDGNSIFTTGVIPAKSESSWEEITELDSGTPLAPGTTYILKIEIKNLNGEKVDEVQRKITTNAEEEDSYIPDVESIYIQERDADDPTTQIAVRARGFDTNYFEANWELIWYIHDPSLSGTTLIDTISDEVSAGDSSSSTIIFDGLSPETTYEIELRVRYYVDGKRKTEWFYETFLTESESSSSSRPDKFKWKDGKEKQSGEPFDITAEEWGNLLDNINAVREYKGYSAISSTSNADAIARFYYPSKGDNFLASMYNQCIYAFEDMELLDYSSYRVLKGDPITADAINFLVETINSVK